MVREMGSHCKSARGDYVSERNMGIGHAGHTGRAHPRRPRGDRGTERAGRWLSPSGRVSTRSVPRMTSDVNFRIIQGMKPCVVPKSPYTGAF